MSETEAYIMPDDDAPPPPKVKAEPAPVADETLILAGDRLTRMDLRTTKAAIRKGWDIPDHIRRKIVERAEKIIDKTHVVIGVDQDGQPIVSDSKADDLALKAGQLILAADNHDQADRHLEDKNKRLDEGKLTENVGDRVIRVEFDKKG